MDVQRGGPSTGLPTKVECLTINKVCGSALKTVMLAAQAVAVGDADVVVAGGMENMSMAPYYLEKAFASFYLLPAGHVAPELEELDGMPGEARQVWALVLDRIAPWSSPGPRRDGMIKPDIAAPGMGSVSLKIRSPCVFAVVPVIRARRAGMQVGVAE